MAAGLAFSCCVTELDAFAAAFSALAALAALPLVLGFAAAITAAAADGVAVEEFAEAVAAVLVIAGLAVALATV